MSTAPQIIASQENAQHSTGPRTESGKAASSQNSLKHGLTAQTVLLPGENESAYKKMCEGIFQSFYPATEPERQLIQTLCDTQWRLNRCARIEAAILTDDLSNLKALDSLSRHEPRLKRQYSTTLKEAQQLIEAHRAQENAEFQKAKILRRADLIDGKVTDLKEIGFVFSHFFRDIIVDQPKFTRKFP